MSARKKVNQSSPRALARAAASRVAGAVCFDTAADAKLPPTRRSSRPPSNSSANADSSMSPAPLVITASVLAECPVQSATPLYLSPPRRVGSCPTKGGGRACHLSPFISATPRHAEQRVAAMLARESECAKAAILRSRCEFHGTRYHPAAGFVTEKSGVSLKFRWMELSAGARDSSPIPLVIDYSDEPIRSLAAAEGLRSVEGEIARRPGSLSQVHLRSRIAA